MISLHGLWRRLRRYSRHWREAELLRWNLKVMGTELARQRYAAGLAGPELALPAEPTAIGLASRLCRQADIEHPWLHHWCRELRAFPRYHRKLWEDCFVIQTLWETGMLAPGKRGLGFAVGQEWLPSLFAARGAEVLATDLDPGDARAREWRCSGQHGAAVEALFQPHLISRADFARRVRFRAVDMAAIPADLAGGFDFLWSVCAFEHLGGLERGLDFVLDAMRCLRPGGIAVHTTEYNLDDSAGTLRRGPTVLYQRQHLEMLARRLAAAGHEMLPLRDDKADGVLDGFIDLPPFAEQPMAPGTLHAPHLRLAYRGYPVTSAGVVIRAAG